MSNFIKWVLVLFILSFSNLQCGGVGGSGSLGDGADDEGSSGAIADPTNDGYGSDSSGSGDTGTSSGSGSLFEGGTVDIPVPIAKVEAINPKYLSISVTSSSLVIEGLAGAVTNKDASPQVWARDDTLNETQTVTTNSDGSFPAMTFINYPTNFTTSVTLAGYDGEAIGTPIFIKVADNTYMIVLTNGSTLRQGALAMNENKIYFVSELTNTNASVNTRNLHKAQDENVTSYIYALTIGGVSETYAVGLCRIDQLFVDSKHEDSVVSTLVRCGNDLYTPNANRGLDYCCGVDDSESVTLGRSFHDNNTDKQYVGLLTNQNFYICSKDDETCDVVYTLENGEEFQSISFYNYDPDQAGRVDLSIVDSQSGSARLKNLIFDLEGNEISSSEISEAMDDFVTAAYLDVNNSQTSQSGTISTEIYKNIYREGTRGSSFLVEYPTGSSQISSGTAAGSDDVEVLIVNTNLTLSQTDIRIIIYSLDARFTFAQNADGTKTLLDVSKTKNIMDYELGFEASTLFFCAGDDASSGTLYAYCPALVPGEAIIEFEDITCNENKNWKCDHGDSDHACSFFEITDPDKPQVRFVYTTQPEFEGCSPTESSNDDTHDTSHEDTTGSTTGGTTGTTGDSGSSGSTGSAGSTGSSSGGSTDSTDHSGSH